jgi:hypothetical protein
MHRCLEVGYLASLRQMHADPEADLVRGCNPGYPFAVMNIEGEIHFCRIGVIARTN